MADVTMPQLGETVTEGTITKWAKQVGDRIEEDEVLFEVSTDKVDSEVPSPVGGFITEILVPEGETVDVGTKLAVISTEAPAGGSAPEAAPAAEAPPEQPTEAEAKGQEGMEGIPESEGTDGGGAIPTPAPAAEEAAAPAPAPAPQPAPAAQAAPARAGDGGDSKLLSPVVRRLVAEHNLDPSSIKGTGAGGRITRADVLALVEGRAQGQPAPSAAPSAPSAAPAAQAPAAQAPAAASAAPAPSARPGERDEVIPFSNIRRRTAEHMVRSLDTSAHTLVVAEVDYENVDRVRNAVKNRFKDDEGFSLSYLPFIARAIVDAIREFPRVNASVADDQLIVHHYVNLGIAVDLNFEGLIVPVVRDAETKRMRALAREIVDLAERARSKRLAADEITGGTFTITNAGGYGTLLTMPIINQPQVAIIGTEGIKQKPVAVALPGGGYGVAVHPVGNLALSFDHRAYDGAYASAFLARVREILETRDWAAEL